MARSRSRRRRSGSEPFAALAGLVALAMAGKVLAAIQHDGEQFGAVLRGLELPAMVALLIIVGLLVLAFQIRRRRRRAYREAMLRIGGSDPLSLSPVQYEHFCAFLLEHYGWKTETTRASGDFGADIIARRGGEVMVVQCKRYAQPVGVKAVQEAHSAASFYGAGRTAVMACRGFTRAAHALAGKTGTTLVQVGENDAAAFR
ncbi:restriction endonuclease [Acidiphilium cryptum]|uniref:Restriction endonuclease n=1 Tax=Acidiphilium cryptum (strain JF-5) TaxID=349163 RepID=A5FTN1_ACICJ|nr:restriction endonuclease [Acidiphilium cryptum]ABQ28963.1 restriction endonuclease [Acidiphilium cryptum JF-5]